MLIPSDRNKQKTQKDLVNLDTFLFNDHPIYTRQQSINDIVAVSLFVNGSGADRKKRGGMNGKIYKKRNIQFIVNEVPH